MLHFCGHATKHTLSFHCYLTMKLPNVNGMRVSLWRFATSSGSWVSLCKVIKVEPGQCRGGVRPWLPTGKVWRGGDIVSYLTNVHPWCFRDEWAIIRYSYVPMHFWTVMGDDMQWHCSDAFIEIKWVLFRIAMYWPSGYNHIFCVAVSTELRCFEKLAGCKREGAVCICKTIHFLTKSFITNEQYEPRNAELHYFAYICVSIYLSTQILIESFVFMLFRNNDYSRGLEGHMRPVTSVVRPASAWCWWLCRPMDWLSR